MDFVSASGILATLQCQWDTLPRYCQTTETFASRPVSRQVGTISFCYCPCAYWLVLHPQLSLRAGHRCPYQLMEKARRPICLTLAADTRSYIGDKRDWKQQSYLLENSLSHLALNSDYLFWKSELALSRQEKWGRTQCTFICPGYGCALHPGQAVHWDGEWVTSTVRALEKGKDEIQKSEFLPNQGILKQCDNCLDDCSQTLQGPLHSQRVKSVSPVDQAHSLTYFGWS